MTPEPIVSGTTSVVRRSEKLSLRSSPLNRVSRASLSLPRSRVLMKALLLFPFLFTAVGIQSAHAALRYVNASAPGPAQDGASWATAYTNLQTALAAATAGDEIWVAACVYKPTSTTDRTVSFVLKNGVAIYGGFIGSETLRDQRNPDPRINGTILSGEIGAPGDPSDNSWHVLKATNVTSATVVDGFTVTLGNAQGSFPEDRGGAIWMTGSSPTLRNLRVAENRAVVGGGIALLSSSSPSVVNAIFHGNIAANSAGAVYCTAFSEPTLINVVMSGNHSGNGGAFFDASGRTPSLINVTIAANRGGGLKASGAGPVLKNSIVWNNTALNGSPLQVEGALDPASSHNLIDDGTSATDPRFVRNPDPGDGNWQTFADNDYGDLHLQVDSPAIHVGQNAANPTTFDLDGNLRIRGPAIDLGAFEVDLRAIWHVDQGVVGGFANGSTWTDAMTNLQAALVAASPGDEIWVARGVYRPGAAGNRSASFVLKDGVAMYGGFPNGGGNGTFAARNPNPSNNGTILSGDIDQNDIDTDGNNVAEVTAHIQGSNSFHILKSELPVSSLTIVDGFLLTAGNANGAGADSGGGALRNVNGSAPTLRNLRFEGNGGESGAAIYNAGSSPILEDLLFVNNRTTGTNGGGGMRNLASAHPVLNRVVFISNIAQRGGGLHNSENSNPILTDVEFVVNSGINMGGGLYNENSSPQLNRVQFYGNVGNFGAAAVNNSGAPLFVNALFRDNRANQRGGAIYNTFSNPRFVNCTFSRNNAGTSGGAIENLVSAPVLQNSILWGNTTGGSTPSQIEGSTNGAASSHNLIQGGYNPLPGAVVLTGDPLFTDPAADDFRLRTNSLAIGAGTNNLVPAGVTTDLAGNARMIPLAVDLGAYEAAQLGYRFPTVLTVNAMPFGNQTIFEGWVPPSLTFEIEFVSGTGTLVFVTPPSVGADGSLNFLLEPGTTGAATFRVTIFGLVNGVPNQSIPYTFTIQVKADVYPQVAFDLEARGPGPQASPNEPIITAKARIRGYFQRGPRKGVVIFPSGFGATLASFLDPATGITNYPVTQEIDPGTGQGPSKGGPLRGYPLVAFKQGFDIYTVEWHDPRTYLQANAMILVDMLSDLVGPGFQIEPLNDPGLTDNVVDGEKVVLVGQSMGGLISRFAMCYLDTLQVPYRCDLFLSVDSPQEGAYVPIGLQYLAIYLDDLPSAYKAGFDTTTLTSVLDSIDQPSPRQMLLLHHSRANFSASPYYAQERATFLALLNSYGNWPTNPGLRMAAIANGRGDGSFQEAGTGGVGAFPTWPKPGGDLRLIHWDTSRAIHDSTRFIDAPTCFVGTLRIQVGGYLTNIVYAVNPPTPFSPSLVFQAVAVARMTVTGREYDIFGNPTDLVRTGTTVIDTTGTDTEIIEQLREFIKQAGTPNVFTCVVLNDGIDAALGGFIDQITQIRDLNKTFNARSGQHWEWLPGGLGDKTRATKDALAAAGTVSKVSNFHCFVPTVSALALSGSVSPEQAAIPANAAELSPFHALYHFGAHANTSHLDDFDGWLGQIIAHELRMLCGEFTLDITPAPLAVSWLGMYDLQTSIDPAGPWTHLTNAADHVYMPATPLAGRAFFRLRFFNVYR